jgi:DNA-directed RNA polymerase sigma subunit (sigma70/sigma32)
LELEGLFSEGNLGLEQALEKFDPTKAIDFLPMLIGGFAKQ